MSTAFLIVVTVLLGLIAGIWGGKGWVNIAFKLIYIFAAVWAAGLTVVRLGWAA